MRVLVVTPWYPSLEAPGAGVFNLRDVELLSQQHEVTVLHLNRPGAPLEGLVPGDTSQSPIERVPFVLSRPGTMRGAVRAIRRLAAQADLVHSMAFPALLPVALANTRKPWVHTEHWSGLVGTAPSPQAKVALAVLKPTLSRPHEVVAVGRGLANAIDRVRRVPATVIGNKVRIAPPGMSALAMRSGADEPLKLVGVGGLVPHKRPLAALDAMIELNARGIDASLTWAGVGPLEQALLERAATAGVHDRLHLLGHVDPEALGDVLLTHHMFVLPTDGETFGVAIAEALGHGLPVVTSGVGGHLDFLPPEASRVTSPEDAALANAITALRNDPTRWANARIRDYAEAQFSEDVRQRHYQEVYAAAFRRAQIVKR